MASISTYQHEHVKRQPGRLFERALRFPNRIAACRRARAQGSLSQSDLATLANVSTRQLRRIECGRSRPSVEALFAIARALDVSAAMLLAPDVEEAG